MSVHLLPRVAAGVAAALLAAAPALAASPAYADGQSVEFTGGSVLSMLVCKSQPSVPRLTVSAEARVLFVNRLGQSATLRVGAQAVATVPANQAVPVMFHYGPVPVSMGLNCNVGVVEQFQSVVVNVVQPAGSASGGGTGSGATGTRRQAGAAGAERSTATHPADDAAAGAVDPQVAASGDAAAGAAGAPPDQAAASGTGAVVVEPLVAASGTPRVRASGMLALLATVCAIGVTVAAIRAIIAQRTTRTRFA